VAAALGGTSSLVGDVHPAGRSEVSVAAVPVRNSLRDRRHEVPFPETATYYFVAATLSCLAGGGVPQRPAAGNQSLTTLRLPA
jgi:hypothetical protein